MHDDHAYTITIVHACTGITVHARTLIIVHECNMAIVHVPCLVGLMSMKFEARHPMVLQSKADHTGASNLALASGASG